MLPQDCNQLAEDDGDDDEDISSEDDTDEDDVDSSSSSSSSSAHGMGEGRPGIRVDAGIKKAELVVESIRGVKHT